MKTRSEIPEQFKWKLEDIYQSEAQWEAEYRELEHAFLNVCGKLGLREKKP